MREGLIFLVRHAPTASNAGRLFMGQTDVPALAVDSPERFRVPRTGPRAIYTSPLRRARASLPILFPGEDAIVDDRLCERSVGEWEGLDHATVRARWPESFVEGVIDPTVVPPGGESMAELGARVTSFLEMLAAREPVQDVYVVTHNGWVRTALLLNGDIEPELLFADSVPFLRPVLFDLRVEAVRRASPFGGL